MQKLYLEHEQLRQLYLIETGQVSFTQQQQPIQQRSQPQQIVEEQTQVQTQTTPVVRKGRPPKDKNEIKLQ